MSNKWIKYEEEKKKLQNLPSKEYDIELEKIIKKLKI